MKYFCLILLIYCICLFNFHKTSAEESQKETFSIENIKEIIKAKMSKSTPEMENLNLKIVSRIVAGMVLIVGIIGTVYVQLKLGKIGLGTIVERPETLSGIIIMMLLPETIVLLSFIISILLILM